MVYIVLQELSLVVRDDSRKIAQFSIVDPEVLHAILDTREYEIELTKNSTQCICEHFVSTIKNELFSARVSSFVEFTYRTSGATPWYLRAFSETSQEVSRCRTNREGHPSVY